MKMYLDILNHSYNVFPISNNNNNQSFTSNPNKPIEKRVSSRKYKFFKFLKINFLILTIPIISYCSLYTYKFYKKTKLLINDYLENYIQRIKLKLVFFQEKLSKEKIKNSNQNLSIELNLIDLIDLNTCLDIINLKIEISDRFIYLNYNNLYMSKIEAIQCQVFEEYFCYFKEIKKIKKLNSEKFDRIIKEKLNIDLKDVSNKLNDEKIFILELNEQIAKRDFYTKEKYCNENKFSLYEFFHLEKVFSYFSSFGFIKQGTSNNIKNKENIETTFNRDLIYNKIFDSNEIFNAEICLEKRNKFTIPVKEISFYLSAFIEFAKFIIDKLQNILDQNDISLADPINISKQLKEFTNCVISNANDIIKEKYKTNIKNVYPIIIQNDFFKDDRIFYYYEELKSYLIKFEILLIDF